MHWVNDCCYEVPEANLGLIQRKLSSGGQAQHSASLGLSHDLVVMMMAVR